MILTQGSGWSDSGFPSFGAKCRELSQRTESLSHSSSSADSPPIITGTVVSEFLSWEASAGVSKSPRCLWQLSGSGGGRRDHAWDTGDWEWHRPKKGSLSLSSNCQTFHGPSGSKIKGAGSRERGGGWVTFAHSQSSNCLQAILEGFGESHWASKYYSYYPMIDTEIQLLEIFSFWLRLYAC